jgi:putative ABC transport system permease protein
VTGGAVVKAAAGGATRRLVQTVVIFCVLAAGSAASLVGLALAASSDELFLGAVARQHAADLAVTIDVAKVNMADLVRTRHLPGVTRAAGPYAEATVTVNGGAAGLSPGGKVVSRRVHGHTQIQAQGKSAGGTGPVQSSASAGQPPRGGAAGSPAAAGNTPPGAVSPFQGETVVGRASRGGPLDDISLTRGRWAARPGEIDIDLDGPFAGPARIGSMITVTSAPGKPKLTVVGFASSTVHDEYAWVVPGQVAALRAKGVPAQEQMLYTFASAGTARQVSADLAELKAALPAGAVVGSVSWLDAGSMVASEQGVNTPFAVVFAVIALVLAVLITASLVSATVVASYRRIGVLKSIGFTPAQVAVAYLAQIGIPALAGAIAGTILGNVWVLPFVNLATGEFKITVALPPWINVTVPLGMLALTGLAALVPALRAGRLSAVAAIAAGQAPPAGRGYTAHRLAARIRLPRPVTMGLAAPFTRPARSAVTLAAITFGLTAVVLATGLDTALAKINGGTGQYQDKQMILSDAPPPAMLTTSQDRTIAAVLRAQPDTLSYAAQADTIASIPGLGTHVPVIVYRGNSAGLGWDMVSGTWYHGRGQVVVNTADPAAAALSVGQALHLTADGKSLVVRITGEAFVPVTGGGPGSTSGALFISSQTLGSAAAGLAISEYEAIPRPGIGPGAYQADLHRALGRGFVVVQVVPGQDGGIGFFGLVDTSLIRLLTILVAVLAGLGVLNAVLMLTRDRVHDLGVFKAIGMTPRQTIAMVTCWVIAPAILAAVIALPAGMILQDRVVHTIAASQAAFVVSAAPGSLVHVYTASGLALLALAGLIIAVIGALGPATWAAASRTTTALRAE